jgi:hypothetical protein
MRLDRKNAAGGRPLRWAIEGDPGDADRLPKDLTAPDRKPMAATPRRAP